KHYTATLANGLFDYSTVTDVSSLPSASWFSGMETAAGTAYAIQHPSDASLLTYSQKWVDTWLLLEQGVSYGQVDWNKLGTAAITAPYNSSTGWTFTGTNIPLVAASGSITTSKGETFSFTGTESTADLIFFSSETWALGNSASVVSGEMGKS